MSRILIAVVSCHQYRPRAQAQRETWRQDVQGADVRVFLGRGGPAQSEDEVILDVDDGYQGLPAKTQAICRWAYEQGYDFVFKCDDDVYVRPERLFASGFEPYDYVGRWRGASGPVHLFPAPYCSGFAVWFSRKSLKIVADTPLNGDDAEDRFVGNALHAAGIWGHPDYRYQIIESMRNHRSGKEAPRKGNQVIAACEFPPADMHRIHEEFHTRHSEITRQICSGPLSKVAVMVKTFLRDGYLFRCVKGIQATLPEVKLVIVDDGMDSGDKVGFYSRLREQGAACIWLPYDSGFGAKANAAIPYLKDHQYALIASDDFIFDSSVRSGIEKMVTVLDRDPSIDIVSGRVNGHPYEALLELGEDWAKESPGYHENRMVEGVAYKTCDLTVNFSLIRTDVLGLEHGKLHWDGGDVKIGGGEHGALFVDAKRLGLGVAVIEDVSIREMQFDGSLMHPMYPQMRNRARQEGRPCLKSRGINRWCLQGGTWEAC